MEDMKKIYFSRSGGFDGFNLNTTISLHELNQEDASELKNMIAESGILNLTNPPSKPGEDLFSYTITIESSQKSQTIVIDQKEISSDNEKLIDFLTKKAKTNR